MTRAAIWGVGLLLFGTLAIGFLPEASGAGCADFSAVSAADGARIAVESPGFLVVERADAGSPVAQASVDSLGTSTAYAAYPDPGEAALSLVPLAGAPRRSYPLFTESSYPATPKGNLTTPAVSLTASSDAHSSNAAAVGGVGSAGALSSAGLTRAAAAAKCADTGEVTARAENTAEALSFAEGVLRIGRVHSMARVVIGASGTPRVESDLDVDELTIAGQSVPLTPDGLRAGALAPILAGAGIEVTYLAAMPQKDGRGMIAPALRVVATRDLPGVAKTVTTFTFGRAFAAAGRGPGGGPALSVELPAGGGSSSGASVTPSLTVTAPDATPSSPATPAVTPAAPTGGERVAASVPAHAAPRFSSRGMYAVLVAACAVLLFGGRVFGRLQWK